MSTLVQSRLAFNEAQQLEIVVDRITLKLNSNLMSSFQRFEQVALRYLALARRMGLPEDVEQAVNRVMRLVTALRMLQLASSLMLATNPVTFALGAAGFGMGVLSFGDALVGY